VKGKNLLVLAAIVLAVGAYIFFFERHQPSTEEAAKQAEKVLPELAADDVISIVVDGREGRVKLEKSEDEWRLVEPFAYPADASKVSSALSALTGLEADRRLPAAGADPAEYGLDEPVLTVDLGTSDGDAVEIVVGDELPLGSKRALEVAGSDEIVVASGWFVNDLDREVDDWRSRQVVDVTADQVASIDIQTGPDHIQVVRLGDEWQLESPLQDLADADHLQGLISDLNSLQIEEFLDGPQNPAELGLDAPAYEVVLVRSDGGEPLRLDLGAQREGESGTEVACRRGDSEYFWALDRVTTRLSKAPVLWRSKKVGPFDTWEASAIVFSKGETSERLTREDYQWRFEDDNAEADQASVQDRLSALSALEATDYDLVAPPTSEMGRVEVILGGGEGDQEQETKTLTFTFYEPLTESGRAMVQVSERDTVMGVETADVDAILGNLEELHANPADDSTAASE
jgi:hypothetical protein